MFQPEKLDRILDVDLQTQNNNDRLNEYPIHKKTGISKNAYPCLSTRYLILPY